MRVLPNGKLETSVVMQGMSLGEEITATWTSEIEQRPDGTGTDEALGFFTAKDGTMGRYRILGNHITKPDGSMVSRGAVCFVCPPGKFAYLNGIAVAYEVESDKDGNVQNKGWEWK